MKLSVVMPCYNERATIDEIVRRVLAVELDIELLIVDDGSTDGTRERLRRWEEDPRVRVILHDHNLGKGAALNSGFRAAAGDVVVVQDADLEYEPREFVKLLKPIEEGVADVVYGSRFLGGEHRRVLFFWHSMGNRFLTLVSNVFTDLNLTDMETCYKMFRRSCLEGVVIEERRFGVEPELTAKFARRGYRIYEVGISYSGRTYSEGKKIGWRDGLSALRCVLKYGLLRR